MTERNQAEEMARSADRITEAVRELAASLDRLSEREVVRSGIGVLGDDPRPHRLSEQEADALALVNVHRFRRWSPREIEDGPPSEAAIAEWEENRERGRREGRAVRTWNQSPPR